jgi:hypothetical protein
VALRFQHRFALGHIAHLAAIAPAFELHGMLPMSFSFITEAQVMWTSTAAGTRGDGFGSSSSQTAQALRLSEQ